MVDYSFKGQKDLPGGIMRLTIPRQVLMLDLLEQERSELEAAVEQMIAEEDRRCREAQKTSPV